MSHLVLLSVGDETTAREGFEKILNLHSVALLTLQGCALIASSAEGRTILIANPPEEVGVQHVAVLPAFAPLVDSLLATDAPPTGKADVLGAADAKASARAEAKSDSTNPADAVDAVTALGDVASRDDVVALLARGEYVLVFLASNMAEGEVMRQLEFLNFQRVLLELSDDALERLELTE
jgi:uncharacterized membrane protein